MCTSDIQGRTLRLYLIDGTPTGILAAELINWTGKILIAPRPRLAELAKRDEVRRTGIYCLVGPDPENSNQDAVYIGEADNVLTRLVHHDKDESKDFWTRTIVITSKDENLTKSHARYLEARILQMAQAAGRARLINGTAPPPPPLPEADVADTEFFLTQIGMILAVLGFSFLQPKPMVHPAAGTAATPGFMLESVGVRAEAREVEGEFVVLKGSTARKHGVESWTSYRGLRDDLVISGKLVDADDSDFYIFTEDVLFARPSAAASVIMARNANGRLEWKEASTGKTYGEWQELQLKLAGVETRTDA